MTLTALISVTFALATEPCLATAAPSTLNGHCPATAASKYDWGTPTRVSNFDDLASLGDWQIYESAGHGGNGLRTPSAIDVSDGMLTITGDFNGNSGGLAWRPGRLYGRWEVCMKSLPASPNYHSVLLLWPESERWPDDGEIDFMEILDPNRQVVTATVIRYDWRDPLLKLLNFHQEMTVDATQWHSWATEWTPNQVVGYIDGQPWFETGSNVPQGPMHLAIQLDNFGGDISAGGSQAVDWVREYPAL